MPKSPWNSYELVDFGEGRKLERWGDWITDRPCPAAEGIAPRARPVWQSADGRYERGSGDRGHWQWHQAEPESWWLTLPFARAELQPTEFGHLGAFPEQFPHWRWMHEQTRRAARPWRILNLFAYTGIATLACADPRHEVVHVDASKSSVNRARTNAAQSGLDACHLRWIVEDVPKFCQRELKRGNRYEAIIFDPPTYGHGPKGQVWQLETHWEELLETLARLWRGDAGFVMFSGHSEDWSGSLAAQRLKTSLADHAQADLRRCRFESGAMSLNDRAGRALNCGWFARCVVAASDAKGRP